MASPLRRVYQRKHDEGKCEKKPTLDEARLIDEWMPIASKSRTHAYQFLLGGETVLVATIGKDGVVHEHGQGIVSASSKAKCPHMMHCPPNVDFSKHYFHAVLNVTHYKPILHRAAINKNSPKEQEAAFLSGRKPKEGAEEEEKPKKR